MHALTHSISSPSSLLQILLNAVSKSGSHIFWWIDILEVVDANKVLKVNLAQYLWQFVKGDWTCLILPTGEVTEDPHGEHVDIRVCECECPYTHSLRPEKIFDIGYAFFDEHQESILMQCLQKIPPVNTEHFTLSLRTCQTEKSNSNNTAITTIS